MKGTTPNKIIKTEDGSDTLISGIFGESYHSKYGAIQESNHVFIAAGLNYYCDKKESSTISILEIGFGTGLNALLSYLFAGSKSRLHIDYHAIEAYPIDIEHAKVINYPSELKKPEQSETFIKMHTSDWNKTIQISPKFALTKHLMRFEDFGTDKLFDIIYFDAFAPSTQAQLWEVDFLHNVYGYTSDEGILVSYCAKGSFKRALKQCGYELESIQGPPGKREMTRATKV